MNSDRTYMASNMPSKKKISYRCGEHFRVLRCNLQCITNKLRFGVLNIAQFSDYFGQMAGMDVFGRTVEENIEQQWKIGPAFSVLKLVPLVSTNGDLSCFTIVERREMQIQEGSPPPLEEAPYNPGARM